MVSWTIPISAGPPDPFQEWHTTLALFRISEADLELLENDCSDDEYDLYGNACGDAARRLLVAAAPDFEAVCTKLTLLIENDDATGEQLRSLMQDVRRLASVD